MATEAKFGIVLIAILLFVFGGLLAKRMMSPSKVQVGDIVAQPRHPADPNKPRANQPATPTLVTPKGEHGRAPDAGRYVYGQPTPDGKSRTNSANSRYSDSNSKQWSTQDQAYGSAAGKDRYAQSSRYDSRSQTSGQQPYRSGYAGVGDDQWDQSSDSNLRPTDPFRYRGSDQADDPQGWGRSSNGNTARVTVGRNGRDTNERSGDSRYGQDSRYTNDPRYAGNEPNQSQRPSWSDNSVDDYGSGYRQGDGRSNTRQSQSRNDGRSSGANGRYSSVSQERDPYGYPYDSSYQTDGSERTQAKTTAKDTFIGRQGDEYTVEPNDSYWTIAEKVYGDGAFFKALYEYNRKRHKRDADEMKVGQKVLTPEETVLRRAYPDACPRQPLHAPAAQQRLASGHRLRNAGKTYTVVEGDTLFEIARYELGKSSRWGEIYELNRDVLGDDTDYLRPGLELILPGNSSSPKERVTRQPEGLYPR